MIEPLTPVVELHSRLGRVGSIQAWDPWKSRQSVAHAKWWVAKVASLSYGNESAKNPEALFQSIVERGHLSCLEFVPWIFPVEWDGGPGEDNGGSLPAQSLRVFSLSRSYPLKDALAQEDFVQDTEGFEKELPATAFLVECPLYIRSQWMRHRSFSYLELSRRYTKGSKVGWRMYGDEYREEDGCPVQFRDSMDLRAAVNFWSDCEAEYQRRLDAGWPNEIARGCMPVEAMTKFWVAGFNRDWDAFIQLRDDPHAQPEIRVFAQWIRNHLHPESVSIDAGNLGT